MSNTNTINLTGERRWKSADKMEAFVRDCLRNRQNYFENHWIDLRGRGQFLHMMAATIPGQYDEAGHGVDIFAMDAMATGRSIWVIEVSRGTPGGAGTFKGGGKPVKYAGGQLQMSAAWREAATAKFLERADAPDKIRCLLDVSEKDDGRAKTMFLSAFLRHRKAVIVPEGCHFDTRGTDIDFRNEVFTFPAPRGLVE
jgi:hypothetical protein